jgi:hypothetical protein
MGSIRRLAAICALAGVVVLGGQAAGQAAPGGPEPSGRLVYGVEHEDPPECYDPPCEPYDYEPGAQSQWNETVLADGSGRRRITPKRTGTTSCPNWRPAFGGYPQFDSTGRLIALGHCGAVVIRNPQGGIEDSVELPGNVMMAAFSPDGRTLAVSWESSDGDLQPIRVVDLEDGSRRTISKHYATDVRWSSLNRIAFWDVQLQRVAVVKPGGKVLHRVKADADFDWAADGRRILYPCAKGVCVVRVDGTHRHLVTDRCGRGLLASVAASPDGRWVACTRGRDIVAVRLADDAVRVIRRGAGPGYHLFYSLDWAPADQS